jgi:hypothetical protein
MIGCNNSVSGFATAIGDADYNIGNYSITLQHSFLFLQCVSQRLDRLSRNDIPAATARLGGIALGEAQERRI